MTPGERAQPNPGGCSQHAVGLHAQGACPAGPDVTRPLVLGEVRFGWYVRRYRKRAALSQGELAELVGISRTGVCNIEAGRDGTTLMRIPAFARALGVSVGALFGETGQ